MTSVSLPGESCFTPFRERRIVWIVDHRARTVQVYSHADSFATLHEEDMIDGGNVLPEFRVQVKEFFANLPRADSILAAVFFDRFG